MHSPSILISLSFINLLSFLHLMPQCSKHGIRAQRGDPGAGLGLCFLLQCVEGIKSDILRCWLTLPAAPPPPSSPHTEALWFYPSREQLSVPKGQLARSIEHLSHALQNWSLNLYRDLYPCTYCGFQRYDISSPSVYTELA